MYKGNPASSELVHQSIIIYDQFFKSKIRNLLSFMNPLIRFIKI